MNKEVHISLSTGMFVKAILIIVLFYLLFYFRELILLVLTSIVIASAVEPLVERMEEYRIPRAIGSSIVFAGILGILGTLVVLAVPIFVNEMANLAAAVPGYLASLELWLNQQLSGAGFSSSIQSIGSTSEVSAEHVTTISGFFFNGATGALQVVFGSLFNFFLVFVLAIYFTNQKYGIDNFIKVVVPPHNVSYALNLWHRSQRKIAQWMQSQFFLAGIIGVLTYFGLLMLGIKYAFLLAIIALIGALIPFVGPIISSIPAIAVGFSTGGLMLGLYVALLYFLIQQLESNFIYPMVVTNIVGIPALIVILALIVGGSLFGFLGIVLSVPVAAALMEYVRDIQKKNLEFEHKQAEARGSTEDSGE